MACDTLFYSIVYLVLLTWRSVFSFLSQRPGPISLSGLMLFGYCPNAPGFCTRRWGLGFSFLFVNSFFRTEVVVVIPGLATSAHVFILLFF